MSNSEYSLALYEKYFRKYKIWKILEEIFEPKIRINEKALSNELYINANIIEYNITGELRITLSLLLKEIHNIEINPILINTL